jgi:hypothetical protein
MRSRWWGVLVVVATVAAPLAAQQVAPPEATIRVFFDCTTYGCSDYDFIRRQIPYVNWVLDRTDADVHVLITGQTTGGGGEQYRMAFIGLRSFQGQADSLLVNMPATATFDEQRRAIAEKVKLGLVRYLAQTRAAAQLRVTYGPPAGPGGPGGPPPGGRSPATSAQNDPWNYWVFSLSGSAYLNGESSEKLGNYYGSVSASRTTEAWKLSLSADYSLEEDRYDLSTGVTTYTQRGWDLTPFAVRSLGSQWAVGLKGDYGRSDYYNERSKWSIRPGVEYDFFPYAQSSRRSLTLQYLIGPESWKYREGTIYEKTAETRTRESLTGRLTLIQPWGQWETSLTGAHYLSDTSLYHVLLDGSVNVRIFKGLSIRAYAYYEWLHDQIYLPAGGVTDEQTLLHLRQLATTFQYYTSIGLEYKFGSIFNNVVNPRFGSSSGMIIIG